MYDERPLRYWLRLYPREFRDRYGEEMLIVVRDRLRESNGPIYKLYVWLDIIGDLIFSLPRTHLQQRVRLERLHSATAIPAGFKLIEQGKPSSWIFLASIVLSFFLFQAVRSLHPCPSNTADQIRSIYRNVLHLLS
jgi:hypothetical protein